MWRHKVNTNFSATLDSLFRFIVNAVQVFAFYTAEMRSDDTIATVAGGVVGGLVGIVLIVVIVIVIVIIIKNKQESSKYNGRSILVCLCTVQ